MKTATKVKQRVVKMDTLRKGGAMERTRRSLKEIETGIASDLAVGMKHLFRVWEQVDEGKGHFTSPVKHKAWAERVVGRKYDTIREWRVLGSPQAKDAKTLSEARGDDRTWSEREDNIRDDQWAEIIEKAKGYMGAKDRALVEEMSDDKAEGKRQTDLAQRVVTTGYKILAATMHPDKGGSQGDMARLNLVKQLLLTAIEEMAL